MRMRRETGGGTLLLIFCFPSAEGKADLTGPVLFPTLISLKKRVCHVWPCVVAGGSPRP